MFKRKIDLFIRKIKDLYGDPHYISLGMAIGVFVAITPTIPFHMILAVTLAFLLKASKPAAILGVWISNPFTVVFLYIACYKTGHFFFEDAADAMDSIQQLLIHLESDIDFSKKIDFFLQFITTKLRTFAIMNAGGVILGLPAGIAGYFLTKWFILKQKNRPRQNAGEN